MLLLLFIHLLVMANEFWVDLIKVNLLVNMIVDARTFFDCAQFTTEKQRSFWNELPKDIFFCSQVTFVCLITYMVVTINFHSNPLIAVEMCVCVCLIWMVNWRALLNNGSIIIIAKWHAWRLAYVCMYLAMLWQEISFQYMNFWGWIAYIVHQNDKLATKIVKWLKALFLLKAINSNMLNNHHLC